MLQLNVDFTLLNKFFGISVNKIPQYANMDIDEIMKAEAEDGNQKAKDYKKILSDPDKILEIFKLSNVENKYNILQNMSEADLDDLLPFLEEEQLLNGLQFFNDAKLTSMCEALPTEELIGVVFQKFSLFNVLELMSDNSMDQFLSEPDVDRKYAQKYFQTLDNDVLKQIMMYSFGAEMMDKNREEYLEKINSMGDDDFNQFLKSMEKNSKANLINGIVEQDESLLLLFKNDDLIRPMESLMKEDKIKLMGSLEKEFLIPMIQELPMDLTQIVLTQIDPEEFSKILASEFSDILQDVVLFSTRAA